VARVLAHPHGLTAYHYDYDYHDGRGYAARRIADRVRRGEPPGGPRWTPSEWTPPLRRWPHPRSADFPWRFELALDDLCGLVSGTAHELSDHGQMVVSRSSLAAISP
jgi:hypothetical protein